MAENVRNLLYVLKLFHQHALSVNRLEESALVITPNHVFQWDGVQKRISAKEVAREVVG